MFRRVLIGICPVLCLAALSAAAELQVGPGRSFARIEQALSAARPGDSILVFPQSENHPYERPAINVATPRITFRGAAPAGRRIRLSGEGFEYSGRGSVPRAIFQFNRGADGCVVEGFEIYGARNGSHNGAGVRINQANDITIRDCHIHNNDMGIMSNGDGTPATAVNQLIEGCLIHSNGSLTQPGYSHNLYLGGTSVRIVGCEVRSSLTGHNVKSRAHHTLVLASFIRDSANRELDLVDAKGDTTAPNSHAAIVGCVIAKSPKGAGNRGVIHFGQDGGNEHDGTLFLAHNTIITPFISPVVALSASRSRAVLYNNIVWDGGAHRAGQQLTDAGNVGKAAVGGRCNWLSSGFDTPSLASLGLERTMTAARGADPPFVDPAGGDYRLARLDAAFVDAGVALPPEWLEFIGGAVLQYERPLRWAPRRMMGEPDLGAFEFVDR